MASYNELNALIDAYINRNGVQAITGQILNGVLKAIVEQIGRGYAIMGVADLATDPGTPDAPESWFASTPGTYTNFGGLVVADAEFAIFSYTPQTETWEKTTLTEGIAQVSATIDGNVGTPAVSVSYENGVLAFDFSNMKGNPGDTGDAAGFGTITAYVDGNIGTPGVTVAESGPATGKNLAFHFTNLKGETGVTSVVATVDNTTGTPSCTVSLVGQQLTLAFSGLKGAQGDTGSSVDYPFSIVNNLTTDDATQALSAAQGVVLQGEITQLEAEVDELDQDVNGTPIQFIPTWQRTGYYLSTSGVPTTLSGWNISAPITLKKGQTITVETQGAGFCVIAQTDANGESYTPLVTVGAASGLNTYSYKATEQKIIAISVKWSTGDATVQTLQDGLRQRQEDIEAKVDELSRMPDTKLTLPLKGQVAQILPFKLVQGRKYRLWFLAPYDVSSVTGVNKFVLRYTLYGTTTDQYAIAMTANFPEFHDFTALSDSYDIWARGNNGEYVQALIEDITLIENLINIRLSSFFMGFYSSDGAINTSKVFPWRYSQYNYCPDYIPVKEGSSVKWNFGRYDNAAQFLIIYDSEKLVIGNYAANTTLGTRTLTMPANAAYIRITFALTMPDNSDNKTPVIVDNVRYVIDDITLLNNAKAELVPTDTEHGIIGEYYPSEVAVVENQLKVSKLSPRFHFIHISDNHGASFGYAQEYLDLSPAKFLINTGDLVADKFADKDLASFQTIALATEPTKPVYLALGNHDYSHATSRQAVFDAFIAPTNTHNGTAFDKTYYSLDFSTEKVKCIVLDMNDGWADADLPNYGPSGNLTYGKMSQTQINWLATQLQEAASSDLHVLIFIHTSPINVDRFKIEKDFFDNLGGDVALNLSFLPDLVDAFISGGTASFTYDGNIYTFQFATPGHFISWVCGHQHCDKCGWMEGHDNQFIAVVCRPYADTTKSLGSYDGDMLGVHWNYCTVDTAIKSFSVYRIGQQTTVFGTDRVSFRILYK